MKSFQLSFLALAVLSLAGCGNHGLSVGGSNKNDVAVKRETTVGNESRVGTSTASKATISVPAVGLAINAIRALDMNKLDAAHKAAAEAVISVAHPIYGWPSGCFSCAVNKRFASQHAVDVVFADEVLDRVVMGIRHGVRLEDPSAARDAVRKVFGELPSQTLAADLAQARAQTHGNPEDQTNGGGAPVQFQIGGSNFSADGTGWAWARNDLPWFGAGKVNGEDVTVALDHSTDASNSVSTGGSSSVTGSESKGTSADASVK